MELKITFKRDIILYQYEYSIIEEKRKSRIKSAILM